MADPGKNGNQCPKEEQLSLFHLTGEGADADLARHAESCPICRDTLRRIEETDRAIREHLSADDCPDPATMAAFLDGERTGHGAEALEHHITNCPSCGAEAEAFRALDSAPPEIVDLSEAASASVKAFAYTGTPASGPAPALPPPAPAAPVSFPRERGTGLRAILGVCALAAGFFIALSLFLLLGGRGDGKGAEAPSDALAVYHLSDGSSEGERIFTPSSHEEGTAVESPPGAGTPGTGPEKAVPPSDGPSIPAPDPGPEEEVEKPIPPEEAPEKTPHGEGTPEGPPPTEVKTPKPEVPRSIPNRAWEVEMRGALQVRPGASAVWSEAKRGKPLFSGSEIRTGSCGPGLVRFQKAGEVLLREGTTVGIVESQEGLKLALDAGEVFAKRAGGTALQVNAREAEVSAGPQARFGIQTRGKGLIYVLDGTVTVRLQGTELRLGAGLSVPLKNGNGKRTPKPFDTRALGRWATVFEPLSIELYHEDFNTTPRGWKGKFERKDTFRNSKGALKARSVKDAALAVAVTKVNHKPLFVYRSNIHLTIACKLTGTETIDVRFWAPQEQKFYALERIKVSGEGWRTVRVPLGRTFRLSAPAPGTLITGIIIGSRGRGTELIVDDVSIHRIPEPPPLRLKGFQAEDLRPVCACTGNQTCEACRVARVLELLRALEKIEPPAPTDGGKDPRSQGESEGEGEGEEEGSGEGEEPGESPSGSPPGPPPPGGPPGPPPPGGPPGPPFPGGPPGPPFPGGPPAPPQGQPRPSGQPAPEPSSGEPEEGEGETPETPDPEAGPRANGRETPSVATPENIRRLRRWLREQLPVRWPPYPGWTPTCVEGRKCDCLRNLKKYFQRYRLKENE